MSDPLTTESKIISNLKIINSKIVKEDKRLEHGLVELYRPSKELSSRLLIQRKFILDLSTFFPQVVLLKGISLLDALYEALPVRSSSDIDLFIECPKLLGVVLEHLEKNGFALQKEQSSLSCYKSVLQKNVLGLELVIEIHQKIYSHQDKIPKTRASELGLQVLTPQENALYLSYHLAHQHTFIRLMWLNDLYLLYQKESIDKDDLLIAAKDYELYQSVSMSIFLLNKYYQTNIPFKSRWYYGFLFTKSFLENPKGNLLRYHLVKILTKDSFLKAIDYYRIWILEKMKFRS